MPSATCDWLTRLVVPRIISQRTRRRHIDLNGNVSRNELNGKAVRNSAGENCAETLPRCRFATQGVQFADNRRHPPGQLNDLLNLCGMLLG